MRRASIPMQRPSETVTDALPKIQFMLKSKDMSEFRIFLHLKLHQCTGVLKMLIPQKNTEAFSKSFVTLVHMPGCPELSDKRKSQHRARQHPYPKMTNK